MSENIHIRGFEPLGLYNGKECVHPERATLVLIPIEESNHIKLRLGGTEVILDAFKLIEHINTIIRKQRL